MADQTELTAHLATEREALQRLAQRAELAEQHRERAAGQIGATGHRADPGPPADPAVAGASCREHRADLAAARADLLAAMAALAAERTHTTQNALPTNETGYDEPTNEFRTRLREIGHQRSRANRRQEDQ